MFRNVHTGAVYVQALSLIHSHPCTSFHCAWIQDPGWVTTQDISDCLEIFFGVKILKFFDADLGWKEFGSGIQDGKNLDPG